MSNPLGLDKSALQMWNNLGDQEYIENLKKAAGKAPPKVKKLPDVPRALVEAMIVNSKQTIEQAEIQMKIYLEEEKYFKANEMRVLRIYHTNNITRLTQILNGQNPFQ